MGCAHQQPAVLPSKTEPLTRAQPEPPPVPQPPSLQPALRVLARLNPEPVIEQTKESGKKQRETAMSMLFTRPDFAKYKQYHWDTKRFKPVTLPPAKLYLAYHFSLDNLGSLEALVQEVKGAVEASKQYPEVQVLLVEDVHPSEEVATFLQEYKDELPQGIYLTPPAKERRPSRVGASIQLLDSSFLVRYATEGPGYQPLEYALEGSWRFFSLPQQALSPFQKISGDHTKIKPVLLESGCCSTRMNYASSSNGFYTFRKANLNLHNIFLLQDQGLNEQCVKDHPFTNKPFTFILRSSTACGGCEKTHDVVIQGLKAFDNAPWLQVAFLFPRDGWLSDRNNRPDIDRFSPTFPSACLGVTKESILPNDSSAFPNTLLVDQTGLIWAEWNGYYELEASPESVSSLVKRLYQNVLQIPGHSNPYDPPFALSKMPGLERFQLQLGMSQDEAWTTLQKRSSSPRMLCQRGENSIACSHFPLQKKVLADVVFSFKKGPLESKAIPGMEGLVGVKIHFSAPDGEILSDKQLLSTVQNQLVWMRTAFGIPVMYQADTVPATPENVLQTLRTDSGTIPAAVRVSTQGHTNLSALWIIVGTVETIASQGPAAYKVTMEYKYNR